MCNKKLLKVFKMQINVNIILLSLFIQINLMDRFVLISPSVYSYRSKLETCMTRSHLFDCKTELIEPALRNSGILIIDYEVADMNVLVEFLLMLGYTKIKTTADSRKAIPLLQTFAPDLILLNLSMPYLSGFRILQLLKPFVQSNIFVPVVVFTADITNVAKQKALSEGASDFLSKPFDLVEVGLRIRNLLLTKHLLQQLEYQNQMLEAKVAERTRDIEHSNIELVAARDKAEASNRFVTTFLKTISNEFRMPLNAIPGFGPLVFDPSFSDAPRNAYLRTLNHNREYLMQTFTDCLDMSLIISGKPEVMITRFALGIVIDEIQEEFQCQCNSKGILLKIKKQQSFNSVIISSDKNLIKKILTHLLENALKFTKEGSITVGVSITTNAIGFFVKDTGIGINADDISILLRQFSPEDVVPAKMHESSGLGLCIVKGMVSMLGGNISVESVEGCGSMFTFTVPWVEERIANNSAATEFVSDAEIKRPIILVAEDEPISFLFYELALDGDFEIIRAEDGEEAVEYCKLIPEIQIVLMDLKMPKMNGLMATREIRKFRTDLPIIALTAYAETGMHEKCIEAGCDEYLSNPISKMELLEKIQKFLITV